MKLLYRYVDGLSWGVILRVRMWIEIFEKMGTVGIFSVILRVRMWIEMDCLRFFRCDAIVILRVRMWIEI